MLEVILRRLAEFQERAEALKRKVKGAMIYPIVVVMVAVAKVDLADLRDEEIPGPIAALMSAVGGGVGAAGAAGAAAGTGACGAIGACGAAGGV